MRLWDKGKGPNVAAGPGGLTQEAAVDTSSLTWYDMVGNRWEQYLRFLHPALRLEGSDRKWVPWKEIVPSALRGSVGKLDWFHTSGVRLYSGKSGVNWTLEPETGPCLSSLLEVLIDISENRAWAGYWSEQSISEPETSMDVSLWNGTREYTVSRVDNRNISQSSLVNHNEVLPDLLWDESSRFFSFSDVDLPSTVVGCNSPTAQRLVKLGIEFYAVEGSSLVVA